MDSSTATAQTTLCPHLIENVQQPLALIASEDGQMTYACTACAVVRIESELDADIPPAEIRNRINNRKCDHRPDGDSATCWPCWNALKSALSIRWATYYLAGEKTRGNRILRLINGLSQVNERNPALLPPNPATYRHVWHPTNDRRLRHIRKAVR